LKAKTAGCRVFVEGGMNRPPYAESADIRTLYGRAQGVAQQVGLALPKQSRGGGSDGNFAAALGVPTLDGLGCPGAGADCGVAGDVGLGDGLRGAVKKS